MEHTDTLDWLIDGLGIFFFVVEFTCFCIQTVLNVLYLKTLWNLETYHANFRRTFIGLNFIISTASIFHLLFEGVDVLINKECFPNYTFMLLVIKNCLCFVDHVVVLSLHYKFLVLSSERIVAMRRRKTYEFERPNLAPKILGGVLLVGVLEVMSKIILFCVFDTDEPLETRFDKAIHTLKSPKYVLFAYAMYFLSLFSGFALFFQSKEYLRRFRSQSQSLSESFEVYQTHKIVNVMFPLLISYLLCGIACSPVGVIAIRILLFGTSPMWEKIFLLSQRENYFVLSCYTCGTLIYTFYKFGIITRKSVISPVLVIEPTDEQADHFAYLRASWN